MLCLWKPHVAHMGVTWLGAATLQGEDYACQMECGWVRQHKGERTIWDGNPGGQHWTGAAAGLFGTYWGRGGGGRLALARALARGEWQLVNKRLTSDPPVICGFHRYKTNLWQCGVVYKIPRGDWFILHGWIWTCVVYATLGVQSKQEFICCIAIINSVLTLFTFILFTLCYMGSPRGN